jgi:hypothetical protein
MFSKQAFSGCSTNADSRHKPSLCFFVFFAVDCNRIAFNNLIKAVQVIHFVFAVTFPVVRLSTFLECFFNNLRQLLAQCFKYACQFIYPQFFFCVINLNIYSHYTKMSNNSIEPVRFDIETIIDFASLTLTLVFRRTSRGFPRSFDSFHCRLFSTRRK